ncbi:anti-sigma factor RsiW [Amycolatopsis endophytica]|uniref:Regulator of SigK n=1 Tax=Amycolatopsis endophytica TaxID=860233 RepID=A0A853B5M0_9PSEU|nr:anti-sigma factor [Amycolatopsis endophytica]NYI90102.1 anti-sigma factor RsiW [Amycolatopsis endophytica]
MAPHLHLLSGAYALDALGPDERARFEEHLGACPPCRAEVAEFRATAARLAAAVTEEPPSGMKGGVLRRIARVRQSALRLWPRSRRPARIAVLVTAAAAVVAVVLGVQSAGEQRARFDAAQQHLAEVNTVLGAPDAATRQDVDQADKARVVASRAQGRAVVLADLPPLDPTRTYQVWLLGPAGARSAGLLTADAPHQWHPLLTPLPADTNRVAITAEPAPGSVQPTTPAVAMVFLD